MGIKPRFKQPEVLNELQKGYRTIENGIIRILQMAGERFVKDARDAAGIKGPWKQRVLTQREKDLGKKTPVWGDYVTWSQNLRSSIGYFVLKDGIIINSDLQGTAEGISAARSMLGTIPNKQGYQLVGVAGMDYASHVESKGYNVITSQGDVALVNIERMLNKFKERMNKKGANMDFDMDNLVFSSMR